MKRNFLTIAAAFAAMSVSQAQVSTQIPNDQKVYAVQQATRKKGERQVATPVPFSGLDFAPINYRHYTSPIWFGKSQRKKHLNLNHVSKDTRKKHKRKLKSR